MAGAKKMKALLVSSVLLAVIALPMHVHGGQGRHAGGHGFSGHHGFRGGHRFSRQPFFVGGTFGWMEPETETAVVMPETVVVIPQFAPPLPIAAPPVDPKFVFPTTPSSPSPLGSHTVVVQRGSQIEVQSFPAAR